MTDIQEWLGRLGLERYAPVFAEHDITLERLPDLTGPDLDRLALPVGPRRKLISAIERLAAASRVQPVVSLGSPGSRPAQLDEAERRQLTVMYCDLVGSTALSERLDPEDLQELISAYRDACGEVVARYDGHIAQYLGDGVVVYFGWPGAHEDDAERSVRAGLEVVQAVRRLHADPPLRVRVGVATGTVVVGEARGRAGTESQLALGETPNLAERLQRVANADEVVIAPATRHLVKGIFELSDLGARPLAGIAQPVRAWRADAVRSTEGRFEAARVGTTLTPLVGRKEEMALLLRRWEQACRAEGQAVLIGGDAGIGKSRLAHELRRVIAAPRRAVLRYQCSPYHLDSAFFPITTQVEVAARFTRTDTPEQKLDKLEAMLVGDPGQRAAAAPLLASLLSLPTDRYFPLDLSPQRLKKEILEALLGQVEALSRHRPVLMIFEDAHWIDPTSQEALDALVARIATLPILLVVTHRPEYPPRWTERAQVTRLWLGPLERRDEVELATNVAEGRLLPEDVLEQIVTHTDGVPLFVEELTMAVLESGTPPADGDKARTALPGSSIPTTLRESLLARLDRLAPVKRVLQIGACIGREFSYELLARVAAQPADQLRAGLQRLTEAGLLHRRGTRADLTYVFKHALVQDAAYDSLLKSTRQQLHARLAGVLETEFADRIANEPELLAHHHTQAGHVEAAIRWWREAGRLSAQRVAPREAVSHFHKGLDLIGQLPPAPDRDDIELSIREPLNAALTGLRGWAAVEVRENAACILELGKRQGRVGALGVGLWAIWVNTITQGQVAESADWAHRLLSEGAQTGDLDLKIFGHGAAMISYFYLGQLLAAQEHGNQVVALYDPQHAQRWMRVTAHDLKTLVGVWSGQWTWMLGYPERAVQLSEDKDAHARALGHPFNLGFALTLGAYVYDYRREPERLLDCIDEANRLEREHSVPFMHQVMVPQVEGLARLRRGELPEAIAALRLGLENWNRRGGHSRVPYLKASLAEAIALQGDVETGLQMLDAVLEQIERPGWQERSHLAEVLRLKGWMLAQRGSLAEAESCLRASIAWAREQQARSWELRSATTLAELLIARGQREAARELLAPIYAWFTEGFATRDLQAAGQVLESVR